MGELIDIRPGRDRDKRAGQFPDQPGDRPQQPERLWREALGGRIREVRRERRLTLVQTSRRAGVSPQYLSEIERGLKDPSSEIVAAIAGAMDLSVLELTTLVVRDLRSTQHPTSAFRGPVALAA